MSSLSRKWERRKKVLERKKAPAPKVKPLPMGTPERDALEFLSDFASGRTTNTHHAPLACNSCGTRLDSSDGLKDDVPDETSLSFCMCCGAINRFTYAVEGEPENLTGPLRLVPFTDVELAEIDEPNRRRILKMQDIIRDVIKIKDRKQREKEEEEEGGG